MGWRSSRGGGAQEDRGWLRFFDRLSRWFDELEGSMSKWGFVLLRLKSNADVSHPVQGNLFMTRHLSLGADTSQCGPWSSAMVREVVSNLGRGTAPVLSGVLVSALSYN